MGGTTVLGNDVMSKISEGCVVMNKRKGGVLYVGCGCRMQRWDGLCHQVELRDFWHIACFSGLLFGRRRLIIYYRQRKDFGQ